MALDAAAACPRCRIVRVLPASVSHVAGACRWTAAFKWWSGVRPGRGLIVAWSASRGIGCGRGRLDVTATAYRCWYDEHPKHRKPVVMATVLQAYQFALDPTPRTRGSLASHSGAALFAYNWGVELVTTRLAQRAAGEAVQVPWTLPELRREWNRAKSEVAPWWAENSKEAYNSGLDALVRALKNWSDSRSGLR
jgi:helix-turn-helix protein